MVNLPAMPTYEYRCEACSHELEAFQSIKDAKLTKCPKCGRKKLERLISGTSFQLKGDGWYKDLYSSPKPNKKNEAA
jgi:putative FmdB family regulatory protein